MSRSKSSARPEKHRACTKIETFDRRASIFPRGRQNLQRVDSVFARILHSVAAILNLMLAKFVLDRASFAVPGKDPKRPCVFRPCGKIETFATPHGPEKSNYLLASTKLTIASTIFSIAATECSIRAKTKSSLCRFWRPRGKIEALRSQVSIFVEALCFSLRKDRNVATAQVVLFACL